MPKIIKISETTITVGDSDGQMHNISKSDLLFAPQVGQEVELYKSENEIVILPKKEEEKQNETFNNEKGININLQNINNPNNMQGQNYGSTLKLVNKVTYILLALFLGGIGVHKFYAGKSSAGIFYLLFCWTFLPSIIALIDALMVVSKPADSMGRIYV